jgi:dihydrofolate synthase / folylpolyglutamate synthase
LDVLSRTPLIVADVAHNAGGAIELCNTLYTLIPKRCVLLFGVMRDKAYQTMIDVLSTLPCRTIAVAPSTPRSLETAKILHEFHSHAKWAIIGGSVAQGIDLARTEVIPDEFILITGSHYVVGEAIKYLKISP